MWMNVLWASTIVTQTPAAPTLTVPLLVHVMAIFRNGTVCQRQGISTKNM